MRRALGRTLLAASAGGALYVGVDARRREDAVIAVTGVARFVSAAWVGGRIVHAYKTRVDPVEAASGRGSEAHKAIKKEVDLESARELLAFCKRHGGVYQKMGQYLSTLNHALPPEWTVTLSALQDTAATRPFSEMARVIEEDLGAPASVLFSHIEEQPLAAATLAQVHRAVTADGREVAVKLQYPGLRRTAAADLTAILLLARLVEMLWPAHAYSWLVPEFKTTISQELDFRQEAANCVRIGRLIQGSGPSLASAARVPDILPSLTSARVLTMGFVKGVKINDRAGLDALGVDATARRQLARTVSTLFGAMTHSWGLLHLDPHPGNVFVERIEHTERGGGTSGVPSFRVVLLDHGMYRRLTSDFRAAYCRLWQALVTRDDALGRAAAVEMGLTPSEYDVLSLILTFRPVGSKATLGGKMSAQDLEKLKAAGKSVTAEQVNAFLQRLPRDLLMVLRAANMVRALNKDLGGTSRERLRILGECAVQGLVLNEAVAGARAAALADGRSVSSLVPPLPVPVIRSPETLASPLWTALSSLGSSSSSSTSVVPLSDMNRVAAATDLNDPTDAEVQAALGLQPSWGAYLRLRLALANIGWRLWLGDLALAAAERRGQFTELTNPEHSANAG